MHDDDIDAQASAVMHDRMAYRHGCAGGATSSGGQGES